MMTTKQLALLIGGFIPAIMLGVAGIFQKLGTNAGVGTGPFLIGVGLTTSIIGVIFLGIERDASLNAQSALFVILYGVVWATATGLIAIALRRYGAQISQLVPLYNMNTLVAVVIGLLALAEWRTVDAPRVVVAAILIIVGGILAANA